MSLNIIHIYNHKLIKYFFHIYILFSFSYFANSQDNISQNLILHSNNFTEDSSTVNQMLTISRKLLTSDYEKGLQNANKAYLIAKRINYTKGIALASYEMGTYYYRSSNYKKSISYFFESLTFLKKLDHIRQGDVYNYLGLISEHDNNPELAVKYYNKAKDIYERKKDTLGLCFYYNNLGNVYFNKDELKASLPYFKKALELNKKLKREKGIAIVHNNLANIYTDQSHYDSAMIYYNYGLETSRKLNDQKLLALLLGSKGNLYRIQGKFNLAEKYLLEAYKISKENNLSARSKYILSVLNDLYKELNQYDKSHYYLTLHQKISDSLFNINAKNQLELLEIQHKIEVDARNHEIELIKKEKERKMQRIINAATAIFLFLVLLFIYYYFRNKIKRTALEKKLLNEKIEQKNKELTIKVLSLANKNLLISDISSELKEKKRKFSKENQKTVQGVLNKFKSHQNDKIWKEFETHFNNVHTSFYNNLDKKYPELTSNERKLCAFLRLNLNTKDIADITHQSIGSIQIARIRLRKKLNLERENNLTSFLARF